MKRFLKIIVMLTAVLCLCFAFAACDDSAKIDKEKDEPHTHHFENYVDDNNATCTKDGTETGKCSCGQTDTRTKAGTALGHDMQTIEAKEPTCTEIGWETYQKCSRCDEKQNYTEREALGHDFQDDFCTRCQKQESSVGLIYVLTLDAESYMVAGRGTCKDTDIVIASVYNRKPVTEIAEKAFKGKTDITSVKIPDSIVTIGDGSFSGCSSLESFTIPEGVTSIGGYSFCNCKSLKSISIPASVTLIRENAFSNCRSLKSVSFESNSRLNSIADLAFERCSSLTSISIPASVTSIGESAFGACNSLQSVSFENNSKLTSIEESAFYNCSSLTEITIPVTVTLIVKYAFWNCSSLQSVIWNAENCTGCDWDDYIFSGCKKLNNVTFGEDVKTIPSYLFKDCDSLQSVSFENNSKLTSIGKNVFSGCSSLSGITIPASVTSIGESAFEACSSLKSIRIPASVTSIGESAFQYCQCLQNVSFESNSMLTSIGGSAFDNCDFKSITIPENVTSIGGNAFSSLKGSITIPASATSIAKNAFLQCINLGVINVDLQNSKYSSVDGILFNKEQTEIIFVPRAIKGAITIPASVTSIERNTFEYCSRLQSVFFESDSKLISICAFAFVYCNSLTEITIPAGVTSIGSQAFSDCNSLQIVSFENNSKLTSIGNLAFQGCSSLTEIKIPEGVTSIGEQAFKECCSLQSVIFLDPNGWSCGDTQFKETLLQDPTTAAVYLTKTYCFSTWKKQKAN